MIPCKKTRADYYEGCHKNCERWKHFLQQSSAERKEKKAYLNAYNELCSTIVRHMATSSVPGMQRAVISGELHSRYAER